MEYQYQLFCGIIIYKLALQGTIGAYRIQRLTAFLNPWLDSQGSGWQSIQGLYAIASGGFFGLGLGNSIQKYLYISEPQNDYIFAVIAEELGFIGCIAIIALFLAFIIRGVLISKRAPDMFRKFNCNWNYNFNWSTSNYKYCCCNIINACYWYGITFLELWWILTNNIII